MSCPVPHREVVADVEGRQGRAVSNLEDAKARGALADGPAGHQVLAVRGEREHWTREAEPAYAIGQRLEEFIEHLRAGLGEEPDLDHLVSRRVRYLLCGGRGVALRRPGADVAERRG